MSTNPHVDHHDEIHLPPPSIAPLIVGVGVTILALGLLIFLRQMAAIGSGIEEATGPALVGAGILLAGVGVFLAGVWRFVHAEPIEEHAPSMNVSSRLLGMWVFLASEIMFFTGLITTFLGYRARAGELMDDLNVPLMTVGTFVLLSSSFTMVLALSAIQKGNMKAFRNRIFLTMVLGAVFLGIELLEWAEMMGHGIDGTTLFGSAFFTLTGFHGLHVIVGLVWMGLILLNTVRGQMSSRSGLGIELFGLYWHFVDIIWIVLFTIIYLL